ncbi:MAG: DsbE family thiol:disulfide interchange protein [Pseudomonadota bacterium]
MSDASTRKISPLMIAPPLIFAALAAMFYFGMQRDDPDALPSVLIGQPVPEFALTPLGAEPNFTADVLAEPGIKLVNYWASWCAPCRVEHPNIQLLADEGIPVYGVNYKDDADKALAFLDELGNPYTAVGQDVNGRTGIDWGLYGVPETFIIDGKGNVVLRFAGPVTQRALQNRIRPALEAAQP